MLNLQDKSREELIDELLKLQQENVFLQERYDKDIREREMTGEKISMLAHALRSTSECVCITDMSDKILFVNTAFLKTYQYEESELIGNYINIVRSGNNPREVTDAILPATLNGGWQGEILNQRKDGSEFPIHISTSVIRDYNGVPVALIGVTTDITQRKRVEKALSESEARMRSITDSAQDAILMMDSKGQVSYWNPSAERIFGYTRQEALGKDLHSFIVPERYYKAHQVAFPNFLLSGCGSAIGKTLDLEARRKDGTEIFVQLSLSSIQISAEWNAIGILRDVTEQKNTEAALIRAKQEAEKANRFKSVFLANMSHEIRTPLNAIIGFSQLLNRDKRLSDSQKEYSFSIIRAGEHLLALINDILELSKIEAGRIELNPSNVDLYALLDDIRTIFKERAKSKKLRFISEMAVDMQRFVFVDESKLRQIFVNLIGNALKFTEEGGIAVRTRIDYIDADTSRLIVEVQDSGPGIAEHELGTLFKQFEQTSSGINNGSGTGLGLALSRELALLMGGDISVTSEPGKGSVFTFHVLVKAADSASVDSDMPKRVKGILNEGKTYRILVVDDKAENLEVVVTLLRLVGFETNEAVNGEDAIAKFEDWNPDLILMDMRMPVMDGYEATRRIKLSRKGMLVPVVALTASTFEDELKKIELFGLQGYIRKPFREDELFATIGNILGITFSYEDEIIVSTTTHPLDSESMDKYIEKLSYGLLLKMQNALAVADLDLLIELIQDVEQENPELAMQLTNLARNYDYELLQQIINKKEKKG
ncbi:MAG: PAS domain S-box protein [Bacteroidota bacterium]